MTTMGCHHEKRSARVDYELNNNIVIHFTWRFDLIMTWSDRTIQHSEVDTQVICLLDKLVYVCDVFVTAFWHVLYL